MSVLTEIKSLAKKLKSERGITHAQALDEAARSFNKRDYHHAIKEASNVDAASRTIAFAALSERVDRLCNSVNAASSLGERVHINLLLAHNRYCLHACGEFDRSSTPGEKSYIPSLVIENQPGHYPMRGGDNGRPWYWGASRDECQEICDETNRRRGLTEEVCMEILKSSLFHADNYNMERRETEELIKRLDEVIERNDLDEWGSVIENIRESGDFYIDRGFREGIGR